MRSLVLVAVLAAVSTLTPALADVSCQKKCDRELSACDAVTCLAGRQECVAAKCEAQWTSSAGLLASRNSNPA